MIHPQSVSQLLSIDNRNNGPFYSKMKERMKKCEQKIDYIYIDLAYIDLIFHPEMSNNNA